MECPNCGSEILKDERFCSKCGTEIADIANDENTNNTIKEQPVKKLKRYKITGIVCLALAIAFTISSVVCTVIYNTSQSQLSEYENNLEKLNTVVDEIKELSDDVVEIMQKAKDCCKSDSVEKVNELDIYLPQLDEPYNKLYKKVKEAGDLGSYDFSYMFDQLDVEEIKSRYKEDQKSQLEMIEEKERKEKEREEYYRNIEDGDAILDAIREAEEGVDEQTSDASSAISSAISAKDVNVAEIEAIHDKDYTQYIKIEIGAKNKQIKICKTTLIICGIFAGIFLIACFYYFRKSIIKNTKFLKKHNLCNDKI